MVPPGTVTSDAAGRVLVVGSVATDQPSDLTVATPASSFARAQLRGRFDMIVLGSEVLDVEEHWQRLIAHNCAAHLTPGGTLAVNASTRTFALHAAACGFEKVADQAPRTLWQRTTRRTIHDLTADARDQLDRMTVDDLVAALDRGDALTIIDVRIPEDRRRHGIISGSVPVGRTVLEWRADPTSGYADEAFSSFDARLVVVCNEGYSSSLAAATLQKLGFSRATDLIGGMVGWVGDGNPVEAAPVSTEGFVPLEELHTQGAPGHSDGDQ